jgi:hypothetical protein
LDEEYRPAKARYRAVIRTAIAAHRPKKKLT